MVGCSGRSRRSWVYCGAFARRWRRRIACGRTKLHIFRTPPHTQHSPNLLSRARMPGRASISSQTRWWRHDGLGRHGGDLRGDGGAPAGRTVAVATTMTLRTCLSAPTTEDIQSGVVCVSVGENLGWCLGGARMQLAQQADLGVFWGVCEEVETENSMRKDKTAYF